MQEQEQTWYTLGELAAGLNIPRWKLAYLIERGELPEASRKVPGRRLFSAEDVEKIRQILKDKPVKTRHKSELRALPPAT